MKKFSVLVVLAAVSASAGAQSSVSMFGVLDTPNAATSSATCAACHGAQGEGSATGAPRLAGQNAQYLERALTMLKEGTRTSSIMQPSQAA